MWNLILLAVLAKKRFLEAKSWVSISNGLYHKPWGRKSNLNLRVQAQHLFPSTTLEASIKTITVFRYFLHWHWVWKCWSCTRKFQHFTNSSRECTAKKNHSTGRSILSSFVSVPFKKLFIFNISSIQELPPSLDPPPSPLKSDIIYGRSVVIIILQCSHLYDQKCFVPLYSIKRIICQLDLRLSQKK